MKNLEKILVFLKPYKFLAFLNVVFNILSTIFSLFSVMSVVPFLSVIFDAGGKREAVELMEFSIKNAKEWVQNIVEYYVIKWMEDYGPGKTLLMLSIGVVVMALFRNLFRYLSLHVMVPIRNGILKDLRTKLYDKIVRLPLSYFTEAKKGDIISKMTNDVQEIEWSILSSLDMIIKDPIAIIINMSVLIFMSPKLTLFLFILLPFSAFLMGKVGKTLKKTSSKGQKKMGGLLSVIEETLGGMRIIKAFNAEPTVSRRFEDMNKSYAHLMNGMHRRRLLASPLSEFMGVTTMMLILYYGGTLILNGSLGLSGEGLIAYLMLFYFIITPAKSFSSAYYNVQKGLASVDRVNQILLADDKIVDKQDALPISQFNDSIEYKNVSFKYDKIDVLKNVNLTIKKGQTIALVGHSGSGKSTMADLLPRFYDIQEGDILIDGKSIKDYKLKGLRSIMGIVSQESILFNDTVANNISFGTKGATLDDIKKAAKIANAAEFIEQMEENYQSNIGDGGGKLSGGQRQRLSIARAILKNPPIMILDEATSALDTQSERLVQDALIKLMENRTSLVIAHRLSTIKHADEICVLQDGEIIERGKHGDLLKKNGAYKRLHDMQNK